MGAMHLLLQVCPTENTWFLSVIGPVFHAFQTDLPDSSCESSYQCISWKQKLKSLVRAGGIGLRGGRQAETTVKAEVSLESCSTL